VVRRNNVGESKHPTIRRKDGEKWCVLQVIPVESP
jgi:hypothetical protein